LSLKCKLQQNHKDYEGCIIKFQMFKSLLKLVQNNLSACLTGRYQLIIDPQIRYILIFESCVLYVDDNLFLFIYLQRLLMKSNSVPFPLTYIFGKLCTIFTDTASEACGKVVLDEFHATGQYVDYNLLKIKICV
jgi:hypothetical protein